MADISFILIQYLHSNDGERLIKDFHKLYQKSKDNKVLDEIKEILVSINEWNLVKIEAHTESIISQLKDKRFITILKIFKNHLILRLLNHIIDKSDKVKLEFEAYLKKNPLLNDALQLSKELNDEILVLQFLEKYIDNNTILGLASLQAENFKNAFNYLSKALKLLEGYEDRFPKQHSFLLRIIPNLFLQMKDTPNLFSFGITQLQLDPAQQDPFNIAIQFLHKAITVDEEQNYQPGIANDYYNLAFIYSERNKIKKALEELKKAQAIHEQIEDGPNILNDIILLGRLIYKKDKKDDALKIYENALNIAKDLDLKAKIAELHFHIGTMCYEKENYQDSLKHLRTALATYKQEKSDSPLDLIETYSWLGLVLREMEKLRDAERFLIKILEVEAESEFTILQMHIHGQLAMTYIQLGDQEEYTNAYEQIISLYKQNESEQHYSLIEYQLGLTFCKLRQFKQGLNHLLNAFQVYYKQQNTKAIEQIFQTLSTVYGELNQPDLASFLSDENLAIMKRSAMVLDQEEIPKPELTETSLSIEDSPAPTAKLSPNVEAKQPASPPNAPAMSSKPPLPKPPSKPVVPIAVPIREGKPEPQDPAASPSKHGIPLATPIEEPELQEDAKPKQKLPFIVPTITDQKAVERPPLIPDELRKEAEKTPVIRICPKCQFQIENPEFTFCPKCATKLQTTRSCAKCGFEVENPDFKFCPKCAQPLDES